MKATIVIPNINGKGWLRDSIESVYAQTEQDFELIIVDNGSTDESLEQARSYCTRDNFTLIENGENTGFSHAVNQGIQLAKGEYVVLFNNDAFAEPDWLSELIRTVERDEKIFAVQSLMIRHYERELADDAGDYMTWIGFACKDGDGRSVNRYTREKRIFPPAAVRRSTASPSWRRSASLMRHSLPITRMWIWHGGPITRAIKACSARRQSAIISAGPPPARCGIMASRPSRMAATVSWCC